LLPRARFNSPAAISQDSLELIGLLAQHQSGMFVREANLSAAALMMLDPNDLCGINVDIFFVVVRHLDQNAHVILPVGDLETKQILT
jgi:hypothetical protein